MKLDLKSIRSKTLEINLCDGTTVHVKKPRESFMEEIEGYRCVVGKENFKEIHEKCEGLVLKILNNNTEGRSFTSEYLVEQEIDYIIQTQIFKAYFDFIYELMTTKL